MYTSDDEIAFMFDGKMNIDPGDKNKMEKVRDRYSDPIINAKLSSTHDVPFKDYPDTPEIVTTISTWMSAYLFVVIPSQTSSQEWLETLWERSMTFLTALEEGEMSIPELQKAIEDEDEDFVFNRLKSEGYYEQSIFIGNQRGPSFGDSSRAFE